MTAMLGVSSVSVADGWDPSSNAGNTVAGGITDTRHNLTMSFSNVTDMEGYRNNYAQVCVYCHTPHGANTSADAIRMPLWNRTINTIVPYKLYDKSTMAVGANQVITAPGPASLTCLSCHDGVTAIDSIINMPGSGLYDKGNETGYSKMDHLAKWPSPFVSGVAITHASLAGCASQCHNGNSSPANFNSFVIGLSGGSDRVEFANKDLQLSEVDISDDHPVGMLYPTTFGPGVDFYEPTNEIVDRYSFFDEDGDNRADKFEIRLYDSGEGYEIECASCHDPHGVPDTAGDPSIFIPSFLRVSNNLASGGSTLCLTCHNK